MEKQYENILNSIEDGYYEVDIAGNLTFFNDALCKIYGYAYDELIGMNNRKYMSPETARKAYEVFNRVYKTSKSTKIFDWEFIKKDGTKIDVEISVSLIKNSEGLATGFRGIVRDITEHKRLEASLEEAHNKLERRVEERTKDLVKINKQLNLEINERKQAEEALKDSEARLKALSEASFESIFLSEKGICLDQNQTAEKMFIYNRYEAIGRHGTEWIAPEDREQVKNNMLSGCEKPYEVTALRKNGTTFPCEIQARMIDYQDRSIRVTALRDITERKRAEKVLQQAHDKLELRVKERTKELEIQKRTLEDLNTTLNVMLIKRDKDKLMIEERVLFNVKELIEPLMENLKKSSLDETQTGYVNTLETFLAEIISPFSQTLHTKFFNLTLSEIRVANLIKEGKTTKEIALLLDSTPRAIEFHRQNLRKKLGLSNRKANLASHLFSLFK